MTIRTRKTSDGRRRLIIDIRYTTVDGKPGRLRRDAKIQTKLGAQAEERELLFELMAHERKAGEPKQPAAEAAASEYTFSDAVRHFRQTHLLRLKPSTRFGYEKRLDRVLVPHFGDLSLSSLRGRAAAPLDGRSLEELDLELVKQGLKPSSRAGIHITFRSVLRVAVDAGMLASIPTLPRMPKAGRKTIQPMHRQDLEAILVAAPPSARLAFALGAYAGLRSGEVRGLRWPDVDLRGGNLSIRRSVSYGEPTTPKSGHHRVIPIAFPLRTLLEVAVKQRKGPWSEVALTSLDRPWAQFGLNQAFERAQKKAKREGWSFHDLRHYFVTELFRRGAPAPAVQLLAGHAELATTQRYADMVASDLRSAIALFDDREATIGATAGATAPNEPPRHG